jgi:hypothetical protein
MAKFEIEIYAEPNGRQPFLTWVDRKLTDSQFLALDAAINHVLAEQGLYLLETNWLKSLGNNLYEFRIRHSAGQILKNISSEISSKPGQNKILLRIFVTFPQGSRILILHGYDKGADDSRSRQQREIATARARLAQWKHTGNKA